MYRFMSKQLTLACAFVTIISDTLCMNTVDTFKDRCEVMFLSLLISCRQLFGNLYLPPLVQGEYREYICFRL